VSTLKVDGIRSNSASSDAITLASDGTCIANITNNLSNRNLIINGAMQVAQRGTSASASSGGMSVDRFGVYPSNTDEAVTYAQVDVASGATPYNLGLTKALKVTNGNQTSGAGADDNIRILYKLESQDVRNSGWNYLSSSSYVTLSFYVKSSVAQNFNFALRTKDGPDRGYVYETGSLSADTWTKVTKTIPGDSTLQFDNDNNAGLELNFWLFLGTNSTGTRPLNAWHSFDSSTITPDQTSTWYTTNDATFEITGVQLEVGNHATDFEHRSYGQELALCQRYFYKIIGTSDDMAGIGFAQSSSDNYFNMEFPVPMRDYPSLTGSATPARFFSSNNGQDFNLSAMSLTSNMTNANPKRVMLYVSQAGTAGGLGGALHFQNQEGYLEFSSEL